MPSAHSHLPHGLRFDTKDDDFQEDSSIKKRMKPHTTPKEDILPQTASQCTICLDSWHSCGPHRICSLKCGHLFGRSCIEKWLRSSRQCPICKAKAQRSHIRPLYVQHLIVADNSEEQRLAKLLGEEIGRREKVICTFREDMEKLHMECTIYKNQVNKLKQELDDERTKRLHLQRLTMQTVQGGLSIGVQPIPSSCPSSSPASRPSTTLSLQLGSSESLASLSTISARLETALSGDNAVDVPQPLATGSFVRKLKTVHQLSLRRSRVLDISCEGHLLASAVTGGSGTTTKWGMVKVSLLDPSHQQTIANLHGKPIRDIKCGVPGSISEDLVLTASEDKALHVVSLRTNTSVQMFALEAGVWACEWNPIDPNYIYCGSRNAVSIFDIRKPAAAIARNTALTTQPLHSLCFLPSYQGGQGLLAASCGGVLCFDLVRDWKTTQLPLSGVCSFVAYGKESKYCAASFRLSPHYAKQCHTIPNKINP